MFCVFSGCVQDWKAFVKDVQHANIVSGAVEPGIVSMFRGAGICHETHIAFPGSELFKEVTNHSVLESTRIAEVKLKASLETRSL